MKEDDLQKAICQLLDYAGVIYYHPANGGHRHISVAREMKALGQKAGVPDLCFITLTDKLRASGKRGFYLELKTEKTAFTSRGKLSARQKAWRDTLIAEGFEWRVAYGFNEALGILKELGYLL